MKYFFALGNNPTLSIAELCSVLLKKTSAQNAKILNKNIFIIETDKALNAAELIKKIGGTIKIGIMNNELGIRNYEEIKEEIIQSLNVGAVKGKFKFGISYYGKVHSGKTGGKFNIKPLAMEIKKYLREQNVSCRWVTSREPTLSSVVVEQNKLTSKGAEIVLISSPLLTKERGGGEVLIGQTLAVQPFKELSFRDYGRPARDDQSGMLPPKLAQIMINLALSPSPWQEPVPVMNREDGRGEIIILDPFCGSGTILTEAMLMGYGNLIGSDNSKKAIEDTQKNIEWMKQKLEVRSKKLELFHRSAVELSKFIKLNSVDAIITEPYLGPQRGKININNVINDLEDLYSRSLAEFKKILKPNGRVVMVWPAYAKASAGKPILQFINPCLKGFEIVNPIPENLLNDIIKLTDRNTIIYGREGQKVWREIVVLEK
ncbi:methyltransferase domain-containing protein [Patescibacteria group bacterium]|nr:methyltransferase domain-containing protein [Candidatus Falkowbacteria bacterium]MBU3906082.1 methyltransferase domain-containing protein [Patescibacteria group bacterium]MBU4015140.1 methyltransferase domain-containing protein [Patescibacteria group bacterium]MBU4025948.1 methyltransferase domain-containing protein [Patescibacteria group bacterium]MBU4073130.1 methyltransferase domain-containing protein [Patescibacteria group bacterium]